MRYGFGKAFILTEPQSNLANVYRLKWLSNKNSSCNRLLNKPLPWNSTLFRDETLADLNLNYVTVAPTWGALTPARYLTHLRGLVFNAQVNQKHLDTSSVDVSSLVTSEAVKMLKKDQVSRLNTVAAPKFSSESDINFLRKECVYTKLKYSRSPQYDAVSGGLAVLFAAFVGFLISEKFGIELVDSGDFFIGFMYLVFLGFIGRLLVIVSSDVSTPRLVFSCRHNFIFFSQVLSFILRKLTK